ncbi:MAG: hypothetical protein NTU53_13620 [Planctomycetota bacterium]|nr:hypothetical protein [Planctomycetota bacterium]
MTRGLRKFLFATRADFEPGLRAIEAELQLQYVWDQSYPTRSVDSYHSAFDIPEFGRVSSRTSETYIVLPCHGRVVTRRVVEIPKYRRGWLGIRPGWRRDLAIGLAAIGIRLPGGNIRYDVYPVDHPKSIVFRPGGLHDETTLIAGEIGTMHTGRASQDLYERFVKHVLRGFERIKGSRVGPEAAQLLDRGFRLTVDAEASPDIDLKR